MGLTMSEKKAVIKAWSGQYRQAGKKEKGRILDEVVELTGYNRRYAVGLLRSDGKVIRVGRRVRLVGDLRKKVKRTRGRFYDDAVLEKLKQVWAIMDCICGKRLVAMPDISSKIKRQLKAEYAALNPAQQKREIMRLQEKLFRTVASRRRSRKSIANLPTNKP